MKERKTKEETTEELAARDRQESLEAKSDWLWRPESLLLRFYRFSTNEW